ncbi:MAG: Diphthamide biosynthesis protein 2 [Watsoniomyces obsoletus]|nr:MAG: Diphthamide biosynthesis protein 2 [Watsoniomyces obsoletus]
MSPVSNPRNGQRIKHPASTNFSDDQELSSVKRLKRLASNDSSCVSDSSGEDLLRSDTPRGPGLETEDVEENGDDDDEIKRAALSHRKTDLESALPSISTDKEAIEEYEISRAADPGLEGSAEARLKSRQWVRGKSSIYVDAFNLALDTVLEDEKHLFDEAESAVFEAWRELPYEAQYLYVRLFLRKTSRWHRINRLGYYSDIADLPAAVETLQQKRPLPTSSPPSQVNPGELEPPADLALGSSFSFADRSDKEINTLEEASSLLNLDELKTLAKDGKMQGKNKSELLKALRRTSKRQSQLGWSKLRRTETEETTGSNADSEDPETPRSNDDRCEASSNRDDYYVRKILAETGPCIRISMAPQKLFERVHLVFYRSTEWTEKSLTTLILARISRRNFPTYIISRSANIFASRSMLLEFEAAIRTQFRVDSILEFSGYPTQDGQQEVIDILEAVYPRWKILLEEEQSKETSIYASGEGSYLRRFSPAWVYTRIIHKGASVLGRLKMHKREHEVLSDLLGQRLFHPSRRGSWYQRKALLEEHYMYDLTSYDRRDTEAQKKHWKRIALKTCEEGLQDRDCHLIYHYDLQKRICKLEKSLKVAKREQHDFGHVGLCKPIEREVEGTRVVKEESVNNNNSRGRRVSEDANGSSRGSTKTIWIDEREGGGECSVEEMCLKINHRLVEIANGASERIIREVHEAESTRETCVVGLDWSYGLEDLLEIVRCFKGEALATICKVFAQEYTQRGGGIPDLFLWHPTQTEIMFVEVKSENDRLSDTQRLWIHVLTNAGIRVELCNAVAKEVVVVSAAA